MPKKKPIDSEPANPRGCFFITTGLALLVLVGFVVMMTGQAPIAAPLAQAIFEVGLGLISFVGIAASLGFWSQGYWSLIAARCFYAGLLLFVIVTGLYWLFARDPRVPNWSANLLWAILMARALYLLRKGGNLEQYLLRADTSKK